MTRERRQWNGLENNYIVMASYLKVASVLLLEGLLIFWCPVCIRFCDLLREKRLRNYGKLWYRDRLWTIKMMSFHLILVKLLIIWRSIMTSWYGTSNARCSANFNIKAHRLMQRHYDYNHLREMECPCVLSIYSFLEKQFRQEWVKKIPFLNSDDA